MDFFNSLTIRIPLAILGGILYGLLTYAIVLALGIPFQMGIGISCMVFLLYLGTRLLILFSGIDTPYYSKGRKGSPYENTPFYRTAQWVGRFYHSHDLGLFVFLIVLAILFVISLIMDSIQNRPFGETIRDWKEWVFSFWVTIG